MQTKANDEGKPDEARFQNFRAGNGSPVAKPAEAPGRNFGGRGRGEKIRTSDPHVPNVVR